MKNIIFLLILMFLLIGCKPQLEDSSFDVRVDAATLSDTDIAETPTLKEGLAALAENAATEPVYSLYGEMDVIHKGQVCSLVWLAPYGYKSFSFTVVCPCEVGQ